MLFRGAEQDRPVSAPSHRLGERPTRQAKPGVRAGRCGGETGGHKRPSETVGRSAGGRAAHGAQAGLGGQISLESGISPDAENDRKSENS